MILAAILLLSQPCPLDASSIACVVGGVAVHRDGLPAATAIRGDTVRLHGGVFYIPTDPITGHRTLAFYGGTLTVSIEGETFDLTPTNGIPLIGPPECGASLDWFRSVPIEHTLTGLGDVYARIDYRDGLSTHPSGRVSASGLVLIRVTPPDPIRIARVAGSMQLSFIGRGSYAIEASADLALWAQIGTVTSGQYNHCEFVDSDPGQQRFYRYRRL